MRPIEVILSGANLLAFLSLAIPLSPPGRGVQYSAALALLVALGQILLEGARWPMIPAYALTVTFFLAWLAGRLGLGGLAVPRLLAGGGIGLGALALLASIALPWALPVFHFPQPTGPYAIGTLTYHWVDTSRPELFTPDPHDHRELLAQIWYPARSAPSAAHAAYIEDADSVAPALAQLVHAPAFLLTHFRYATTNAIPAAPVAADRLRYPVLVFLSGTGGFRASNTFQIEELVSHGYVVVGLDQPRAAALVRFPDGRQVTMLPREQYHALTAQSVEPVDPPPVLAGVALPQGLTPYFAQDVSFALDQMEALNTADPNNTLTGRLALERVGTFGISLGGRNAAEACLKDQRLGACLIMDVSMPADVVQEGLQQPAMWITRDAATMRLERQRAGGWTEQDITEHQTTMRAVYTRLRGAGYYLQIPGMFHLNLTDAPYWSPVLPALGLIGPADAQRIFRIVNAYTVAFFDKHIKGQPAPLLSGPSNLYPEVTFESRRP